MADRPYAAIGQRIRALREVHELTQAELGRRCYVVQAAVSYWESGQKLPNRPTQHLVADALRTSRSVLFREVVHGEDAA